MLVMNISLNNQKRAIRSPKKLRVTQKDASAKQIW
jgi:hypothetical protein